MLHVPKNALIGFCLIGSALIASTARAQNEPCTIDTSTEFDSSLACASSPPSNVNGGKKFGKAVPTFHSMSLYLDPLSYSLSSPPPGVFVRYRKATDNPSSQSFVGWKYSGTSGKGALGPHYVQQFLREQNQTVVTTEPPAARRAKQAMGE